METIFNTLTFLGNEFALFIISKILDWLKTVPLFSKLAHWYEEKLVKKADQINEYAKWGLFLLVAIPLPGTGAWTGVLVATFLNMKMRQALPMIFLGVLAAGIGMVIGSYGLFGAIRLF